MIDIKSPNFEFLANLDPALMRQAALAERHCIEDPNSALVKLRLFGELLAKNIAARFGVYIDNQSQQVEVLKELKYKDVLDQKLADKLIDQQLLAADWETDTDEIRYSKGVRPEKGKNKAIAEWPTKSGPADYVLFNGLTAIAVIEAKRKNLDVYGVIDQAKRYSKSFLPDLYCKLVGGPWGKFNIPFVFATNGRPFLRQMENQPVN